MWGCVSCKGCPNLSSAALTAVTYALRRGSRLSRTQPGRERRAKDQCEGRSWRAHCRMSDLQLAMLECRMSRVSGGVDQRRVSKLVIARFKSGGTPSRRCGPITPDQRDPYNEQLISSGESLDQLYLVDACARNCCLIQRSVMFLFGYSSPSLPHPLRGTRTDGPTRTGDTLSQLNINADFSLPLGIVDSGVAWP